MAGLGLKTNKTRKKRLIKRTARADAVTAVSQNGTVSRSGLWKVIVCQSNRPKNKRDVQIRRTHDVKNYERDFRHAEVTASGFREVNSTGAREGPVALLVHATAHIVFELDSFLIRGMSVYV